MRSIPNAAVTLVAKWEGVRLTSYPDPASPRARTGKGSGAPWTIGYGHTGPDVEEGQTITTAKARALLKEDLKDAARKLAAKIGPIVDELTENQYAALLSFVFNLGTGDPKKPEWQIWKLLRARHFDQVHLQFGKFVNAGGRKLQGLVNRRADEAKLWAINEPGSDDENLPSSVTRRIATPPTPSDPVPPSKSASLYATSAAAVAGVGTAVVQVKEVVEPFRYESPLLDNWITILAVIGAIAAVIGLVLTWINKRKART